MTEVYDIAVIGCGPAGISAAINSKIRNKKTLFLGGEICSVKMRKSPLIFNYLGFSKIKGDDLIEQFLKHMKETGVEITKEKVSSVYSMENEFNILCSNNTYRAKAVIIATGVNFGQTIPGEAEFLGKGVGYCATCDAPLYRDEVVAVIGYTKDGEEEAGFLAETCKKVYYIPLYEDVGKLNDSVSVIREKPVKIVGDKMVTRLVLNNQELEVAGVFIIKETVSPEQLIPGLEMDGHHIKVNRNMMTNIQGLYAAGDCSGKPYQLAKAVGEGQIAALHAVGYIDQKVQAKPQEVTA